MMSLPAEKAFERQLRRALRHLYEPVELCLSPLAGVFGLDRQTDVPSELRRILTEAIHALKPGDKVPSDSNAWRMYQVLCYRYEEQFSQEEVAEQMAVSPRQVRRLEATAIRALVDVLVRKYKINLSTLPLEEGSGGWTAVRKQVFQEEGESISALNEFDRLKKTYTRETIQVKDLVESVLQLSQPLLQDTGVELSVTLPSDLPPVNGQMTTLRQALLNLFMAAIRRCPLQRLNLQAREAISAIQIDLWSTEAETSSCEVEEFLQVAQQLAELSQGTVYRLPSEPGRAFGLRMSIPVAERIPILMIDDNEDNLLLFERYLERTRYRFYGALDADQAVALAERYHPRAILLDIMLPRIDGWEVLGRIRAHPSFEGAPVIILTILPYEQLAMSLGAAGFLRKPVSREKLLAFLDQLLPTQPHP